MNNLAQIGICFFDCIVSYTVFSAPEDRIVFYDFGNFRGNNATLFCDAAYLGLAVDNKATSVRVIGNDF